MRCVSASLMRHKRSINIGLKSTANKHVRDNFISPQMYVDINKVFPFIR